MDNYMKKEEKLYQPKSDAKASILAESPLEKITSSYTKMAEKKSSDYNIDNCNCGNCFCIHGDARALLSPAGIAVTVSAFGPVSAMH